MAKKIKTNFGMMIGRDMTTVIGRRDIDEMTIEGMIGMMITEDMRIVEMIIVGIIVTETIPQEMTGSHTGVTGIMMIEDTMVIIDDTMMMEGMIIEDPKALDNFNIIRRVEIKPNHMMFENHNMKRVTIMQRWSLCKSVSKERQRENTISEHGHERGATSYYLQ